MGVSIHKLIAAINPDVYCDPSVRKDVKKIVRTEGYLKAAEIAKARENDWNLNYGDYNHLQKSMN